MQTSEKIEWRYEMKELVKRRDYLRERLKDHFCSPVSRRSYSDFEAVVDELDEVRSRINNIKNK